MITCQNSSKATPVSHADDGNGIDIEMHNA